MDKPVSMAGLPLVRWASTITGLSIIELPGFTSWGSVFARLPEKFMPLGIESPTAPLKIKLLAIVPAALVLEK
jgi:hypothetical protein